MSLTVASELALIAWPVVDKHLSAGSEMALDVDNLAADPAVVLVAVDKHFSVGSGLLVGFELQLVHNCVDFE